MKLKFHTLPDISESCGNPETKGLQDFRRFIVDRRGSGKTGGERRRYEKVR